MVYFSACNKLILVCFCALDEQMVVYVSDYENCTVINFSHPNKRIVVSFSPHDI